MQVEKVIDHIVNWLKDYSDKSGTNGFVIGVSGGIDSAVTSTLCARTGKDVLVLEMPIHQAESQVSRASDHIDWLQQNFSNVKSQKVSLTSVFEQLKDELPEPDAGIDPFMSLANTRARLRMTTLYYFAALKGYLVVAQKTK